MLIESDSLIINFINFFYALLQTIVVQGPNSFPGLSNVTIVPPVTNRLNSTIISVIVQNSTMQPVTNENSTILSPITQSSTMQSLINENSTQSSTILSAIIQSSSSSTVQASNPNKCAPGNK